MVAATDAMEEEAVRLSSCAVVLGQCKGHRTVLLRGHAAAMVLRGCAAEPRKRDGQPVATRPEEDEDGWTKVLQKKRAAPTNLHSWKP